SCLELIRFLVLTNSPDMEVILSDKECIDLVATLSLDAASETVVRVCDISVDKLEKRESKAL
ncbi:hypothetical protein, partial [Vibrio anguillarum]|uniref:hypothetical protein n=1 Tax=Vibrio anguillarum TaxID=55601 RepID=UPI001BE4DCBF